MNVLWISLDDQNKHTNKKFIVLVNLRLYFYFYPDCNYNIIKCDVQAWDSFDIVIWVCMFSVWSVYDVVSCGAELKYESHFNVSKQGKEIWVSLSVVLVFIACVRLLSHAGQLMGQIACSEKQLGRIGARLFHESSNRVPDD